MKHVAVFSLLLTAAPANAEVLLVDPAGCGCSGYPDIDVGAWLFGGFMIVIALGRLIRHVSKK